MASPQYLTFQVKCCLQKSSCSHNFNHFKTLSSALKPFQGELHHQLSMIRSNVSKTIKDASVKLLDAFVDRVFEITDQPLPRSQSNFAPVDELGEAVLITSIEGEIPNDFPEDCSRYRRACHNGVCATEPFVEVGIISADGNQLLHKMDLKLNRCTLFHEMGVTQRYNVIMDFPLSIDINRVVLGRPLIKYEHELVMLIRSSGSTLNRIVPFTFSIVSRMMMRALESFIPGPDLGLNKFEWFSRKLRHIESVDASVDDRLLFTRLYDWRLNMKTGDIKERNLTGTKFSKDFPMINADYSGIKNKYGYTQVVDSTASFASGMPKFGGLAKLYLEEPADTEGLIKVKYHKFEENVFFTGSAFVSKGKHFEEDDGWTVSFVHNEDTDTSQTPGSLRVSQLPKSHCQAESHMVSMPLPLKD
ncbi:hypothetical protein QYF36_011295 [Acer negundo]|nr:hypothetical protein QYF36_011295 [Acer negundo]